MRWLHDVLGRTSRPYGAQVALDEDGTLVVRPAQGAYLTVINRRSV
ncbi:hypothetical protein [Streptomyces globisporus]|nr:hypothetical protein [Streptomyces globisporus]